MKKFLQIIFGVIFAIFLLYGLVVVVTYFQYNSPDFNNKGPVKNSEISQEAIQKIYQKSLSYQNFTDKEIFTRESGDFFPITILMKSEKEDIKIVKYSDLEIFLKNAHNISGIRFLDNFESQKTYSKEDFLKIISFFVDYGKLSESFVIEGKLQAELFQDNEILDKILSMPVKNLQIFSYGNGELRFSREQLEKMKKSNLSLLDISNYDGCAFDEEKKDQQIIYVNKLPKIFCYLKRDANLPILFLNGQNGERKFNPDYLAHIYAKAREFKGENIKINDQEVSFEEFEKMSFDSGYISLSLSESHSREYLIAVLERLSHEKMEHIHLKMSFSSLDYEVLEMFTRLNAKRFSLDIAEAYNWRIPKFVIPENFVQNFERKFDFFGIVTSTGMGGVAEVFFEKNGKELQNIDEKLISTTAVWLYENHGSNEEKKFSEKFYIKNPHK